jgi:hypothetical protein
VKQFPPILVSHQLIFIILYPGNKAFSTLYKQRVPHSFRVVNEGDAITGVPNYLCCGGIYKHAGLEVILDEGMTGNILVGPTIVETLFRFHKIRTNVAAHQMARYRDCLECSFESGQLLDYYRGRNVLYQELVESPSHHQQPNIGHGSSDDVRRNSSSTKRNEIPEWMIVARKSSSKVS